MEAERERTKAEPYEQADEEEAEVEKDENEKEESKGDNNSILYDIIIFINKANIFANKTLSKITNELYFFSFHFVSFYFTLLHEFISLSIILIR